MTQFAIYFNMEDFSSLAGTARAAGLPNSLRSRVTPYWNGGLKDWASAPLAHAPGDDACSDCRRLIINVNNGSLAEFRQLLLDIAAHFGTTDTAANYLVKLANELQYWYGGKDPYP